MLNKDWGAIILKPSCKNLCVFCGPWPEASEEKLRQQEKFVALARRMTANGANAWLRLRQSAAICTSGNAKEMCWH